MGRFEDARSLYTDVDHVLNPWRGDAERMLVPGAMEKVKSDFDKIARSLAVVVASQGQESRIRKQFVIARGGRMLGGRIVGLTPEQRIEYGAMARSQSRKIDELRRQ